LRARFGLLGRSKGNDRKLLFARQHDLSALSKPAIMKAAKLKSNKRGPTKRKKLSGWAFKKLRRQRIAEAAKANGLTPTIVMSPVVGKLETVQNWHDQIADIYRRARIGDLETIKTTFEDNQRFPEPLRQEMDYLRRVDDDAYRHVWLGECRQHSDAQVFKSKYTVESFEPKAGWDGPYHGLDLGFSADPSVLTKCWVADNRLYVEREAWQLHCDIDKLPNLLDQITGARGHCIRVDSSRPETVSYLKQHGFPNCESVDKWPDSVQDGISRMRAFEQIVLHPSCEHTIQEFRMYSYKQDRLTGDVLPDIIDKHNHAIDSIRYAIAPIIKQGGAAGLLQWYAQQAGTEQKKNGDFEKRPGVVITELTSPWH
jgi:phage terminase large subunit